MPNNIAAIDLGSNSFHMIVARLVNDQLQVVDRLREMVQLGSGLDRRRMLSDEAQARGLECLSRFSQRLADMPDSRVRIVGTNTLRRARNGEAFVARAEAMLGYPVEIVSGMEEARLIYLGVSHCTADVQGQRLVIDIGGGSTELIVGEKFEPSYLESLEMGCVSMTKKAFDKDKIGEADLRAAELMVKVEMEPVDAVYRDLGWTTVTGASGSIRAIRDVVVREGWCIEGITLSALRQLRSALRESGSSSAIAKRWGLSKQRAAVFTGGFAVLYGVCETLGIEEMQVSECAMREGLIYDLVGRIRHEDVRGRTIDALNRRYGLDSAYAERVAATALQLLAQVQTDWQLENEELPYYLEWATRLHEIGLAISHSKYHKHGAYIVHYSDLPGFSQSEQRLLAVMIRGHRRKFPVSVFEELPENMRVAAQRLCILLRLAVILHRSRSRQTPPLLRLSAKGTRINLEFPPGWLEDHPLTCADLEAESQYLKAADYKLSFA